MGVRPQTQAGKRNETNIINAPPVFFTSDTHFSEERCFTLTRRQFKNLDEMDEAIITNWNAAVKENDTVYHLGDFGNLLLAKKLNGKITLILGNYETKDMKVNFGGDFEKFSEYLRGFGFHTVIEKSADIEIAGIPGEKIHLVHEPLDCNPNKFNLFGHIHSTCMVKKFGLNVGISNFNYKPATVEEIIFYKEAIQKHYDENVFCTEKNLKKSKKSCLT